MKSYKLIFFLLLTFSVLQSEVVKKEDAQKAAVNWMNEISGRTAAVSGHGKIDDTVHIFNFEGGGFVLMSSEDSAEPVLAYSKDGRFDLKGSGSNISFWTGLYSKAVKEIRDNDLKSFESEKKWQQLISGNFSRPSGKAVAPLLTTTWDQGSPFNNYCPMDGGSRSVVGCVATAMAQIMKFHSYPLHGNSSHSYSILGQTLSVDYFWSTYNWDMMTDSGSGANDMQEHEMAQISYHAGVAVEMSYSAEASGAYSANVPYALENYFKYDTDAAYLERSGYSDSEWQTMITEEINSSRPVYYSGSGPDGGHAFITDGYDTPDYFHFNWGWGGYSDGYYYLDNLNPGGSTFNNYQAIVKNIHPAPVDIVQQPIEDIESTGSQIVIDLSEYFSSNLGDQVSYEINASSEIVNAEYDLTGSILTIDKISAGLSKFVVVVTTRNDGTFDEFYLKFTEPVPVAGFGNTYNFDGVSYVDCGNSAETNSLEHIALSFWFKMDQSGANQGIISKSTSTSNGWYVLIQSNDLLKFFVETQDGYQRKLYSETTFEADRWYHIDINFDGKDLFLYVDGEFDSEKTTYNSTSVIENDASHDIKIGAVPGMNYTGSIDEVIIWKEPRTLEQFRHVMNTGPDPSDVMIAGYWKLDETFGYRTIDQTGNHICDIIYGDLSNWTASKAPLVYFTEKDTDISGALSGYMEGETLDFSIAEVGTLGAFDIWDTLNGQFTYTPDAGIIGTDTLAYSVSGGGLTSENVSVIINVKEPNSVENNIIPSHVVLEQNYPNPFNPETKISFSIERTENVKLSIFDSTGKFVRELVQKKLDPGKYSFTWDGKDNSGSSLSTGIYYYRLSTPSEIITKRSIMIK